MGNKEKLKKEDKIFIVKKAWDDPMENHPSNAFGYSTIGLIRENEITDEIRNLKFESDGWASNKDAPLYIFKKVKYLKSEDLLKPTSKG